MNIFFIFYASLSYFAFKTVFFYLKSGIFSLFFLFTFQILNQTVTEIEFIDYKKQ
jgi:hypothetical protein